MTDRSEVIAEALEHARGALVAELGEVTVLGRPGRG